MKGICFKEPLFYATIGRRKTQTRRIITPQPEDMQVIATKAVELAEEDARERAVRAFRKSCKVGCILCFRTDCPPMSAFLKHYDNES